MVDELKKITINKSGVQINTSGDCILLSDIITEKTGDFISYNTLRRLFGLVSFVKPSINTLNILAEFNGYKSYAHFVKISPKKAYWIEKEKLYLLINTNPKQILNQLNTNIINQDYILDFIISFCRELIYKKEINLLQKLFNSSFFERSNFNYSEKLHFGNAIGQLLIYNSDVGKKLLSQLNFINFVYCIHVDYTHLNGYYGDWNKQVHEEYKDGEIGSFSESILQLKNFLNVRSVTYDNLQKVNTKNFHPILIGRIYSIKFLSSGYQRKDIKQIFKSHLNIKNQEKVLIDFFYEPIMLALLTKNFNLMGDIINFLSNKKVIFSYYQEAHKCQFDLMCLIFKFSLKKVKEKPNDFELMRNEIEHRYSYRDLFEMFVLVLEFHSQGKKEYTMKLYNKISKKLNYPLFSKDYLLRYFDK